MTDHFFLPANLVFQPTYLRYKPIAVRSTYTIATAMMLFDICELAIILPYQAHILKTVGR